MLTTIDNTSSNIDINDAAITEPETGIFEYIPPRTISTETWLNEHLDCDAIIDNLGSNIIVYAFTRDPEYNFELKQYKKSKNYAKQHILRGISSDGLNSLFYLQEN